MVIRKVNRIVKSQTSEWITKYLSTMNHDFYFAVPQKYYVDSLSLSHLQDHFSRDGMRMDNFKRCFSILNGDSVRNSRKEYAHFESTLKVMYDIIHGRFCVSEAGLEKIREKYEQGVYGKCPRVYCDGHLLLPVGMHDLPGESNTKLFCAKCRDIYQPPKHVVIDSAAFGTSLPHFFLGQYPDLCPTKPNQEYVPKIYGFRINSKSPVLLKYENRKECEDKQKFSGD